MAVTVVSFLGVCAARPPSVLLASWGDALISEPVPAKPGGPFLTRSLQNRLCGMSVLSDW